MRPSWLLETPPDDGDNVFFVVRAFARTKLSAEQRARHALLDSIASYCSISVEASFRAYEQYADERTTQRIDSVRRSHIDRVGASAVVEAVHLESARDGVQVAWLARVSRIAIAKVRLARKVQTARSARRKIVAIFADGHGPFEDSIALELWRRLADMPSVFFIEPEPTNAPDFKLWKPELWVRVESAWVPDGIEVAYEICTAKGSCSTRRRVTGPSDAVFSVQDRAIEGVRAALLETL